MELSGCGTALVTPFTTDGQLDEPALRSLVHWQIESGIRILVACGTTGETPTLTEQECFRVIELTIEASAGRVPVIAGCTHNSTREAATRASRISRLPGLSGILTANPYYNRPMQEGQYQHFKAIAESSALPVILYNIPSRTGANLEPATVARLADDCPNIVAIKESSGSITQITEVIHSVPRRFQVFAGDDSMALPVIALGGSGLISVASNLVPADMAVMISSALANDWTTARTLSRKYFRLIQALFWETSPGPVKSILAMMDRIEEEYRLPMTPVTPGTRARLAKLAGELGLLTHAPQEPGDYRMF